MPRQRIFVSATTRDLGSYRELASKTLRERGYVVDDQAIFNLTYQEIGEKLKQRIADCDAVVCLIGSVYGGEPSNRQPDQRRRSYTQWEYFLSRELGKDVYLLLAGEETPVDPDPREPESDELRQLQYDYRTEVIHNRDWRPFASKDQLRAELALLRFRWEGPPPDHKPANLPDVSLGTLFKGRIEFLNDLRQRLGAVEGRAAAIIARQVVHGLGGVGKTRAAIEYAWKFAGDYTALLFVSADSAVELRAKLANLVGVLAIATAETAVEARLADVLNWLDAHPGWLLILDNVDTEEAAREVHQLLARLRAGHVLITSRIANWRAGVEPLELHILAQADAVAFLLERTTHRRHNIDDDGRAAEIARELDGLALALEQTGAYINKLRLSLAEYLERWLGKRAEVLKWHDERVMGYPASVAATWETTFAQLGASERRLLEALSWLAAEPIPLFLFETETLTAAVPEARDMLADLAEYSLARFDESGDGVLVHRLVQEITRGRIPAADRTASLQIALNTVNDAAVGDSQDVRTWEVWTPLAAHAEAVSRYADADGIAEPTAGLMNALGLYWNTRGQFRAAEPLMRRALSINERSFGPDHPDVARHLNNLAQLLKATNRLAEAEPLMRRALAIDERSFGPDHPDVARDLNNLAMLLGATNRLAEAEPLMRRALAIDERRFGPDDPKVAIRLNNLAQLLQDTNRLAEAEPLMRRALAIDERSFGPDHPDVAIDLNNLAQLLQDTNRLVEAEPLLRRALAINERSFGPDHTNVARNLNNLAQLLQAINRLAEAEPLMHRALAIDERTFGPDHTNVAIYLKNLALLLKATNRVAEAEPLFRRSIQIMILFQRRTGHEHPKGHLVLNNYRDLLQALGKTTDQVEQELRELDESLPSEGP